jgi:hypothetical protein
MARARPHRRTLALHPPPTRPLHFLVKLGRALGATTDADAIDRCATIGGVQAVTLLHAVAMGTLANLPTHAVRTLMQVARSLPDVPTVDIGDLAPLDPAPVKLLVAAVGRR